MKNILNIFTFFKSKGLSTCFRVAGENAIMSTYIKNLVPIICFTSKGKL